MRMIRSRAACAPVQIFFQLVFSVPACRLQENTTCSDVTTMYGFIYNIYTNNVARTQARIFPASRPHVCSRQRLPTHCSTSSRACVITSRQPRVSDGPATSLSFAITGQNMDETGHVVIWQIKIEKKHSKVEVRCLGWRDRFQHLMTHFLSKDTFVVKFSWKAGRVFLFKVANRQTDKTNARHYITS